MTFMEYMLAMWKERKEEFSFLISLMTIVAVVEAVKVALVIPLLNYVLDRGIDPVVPVAKSGFLGQVTAVLQGICGFLGVRFTLGFVLVFIIGVFLIGAAIKLIQMHFQYKLWLNYMASLSDKLFHSYFSAPWSFFIHNKSGRLTNIMAVEVPRAGIAFRHLCMTMSAAIIVLLYVVLAMLISWKLTLFVFLMFPLFFLLFKRLTRFASKYGHETTRMNSQLQADLVENILAAKMIKASAVEKRARELIRGTIKEVNHYRYLTIMNKMLVICLQEPAGAIILCLTVYICLKFFSLHTPLILLLLVLFFRLAPRFYELQRNYQQTLSFIPAFEEVNRMTLMAEDLKEESGQRIFKGLEKGIKFNNVSFSYEKNSPVLEGIDLEIPKGKIVGIVGGSGCGKSTIADLLVGLIQPNQGDVLVDGVPLSEYAYNSWRSSIGYVTQETNLFHETVRFNLTWNRPDATEEQMIQAAKLGNAHEFIKELPEGYDTIIGDRGYKLSGGQRQRLALSRVILFDPKIFIFDEATSALDSESEVKIQQSIDSLASTRTTLIIAHRISTLRHVDNIYVMEGGRFVESGSWDDLVKKNGIFKQLISMQTL